MLAALAIALLVLGASDAAAQRRVRPIASWSVAGRILSVEVEDGSVHVRGRTRIEAVSAVVNPGEARLWLDSARALARRPMRPAPGERLEAETTTATLQTHMLLHRTVTSTGSTYRLDLHDLSVDASVLVPMGQEQVSAFLRAIPEAARIGDEMRRVVPAPSANSADVRPALTLEARQMIAAALRHEHVMVPIEMEAVVLPSGALDSASVYVLGGRMSRFPVETIAHRLKLTPAHRLKLTPALRDGNRCAFACACSWLRSAVPKPAPILRSKSPGRLY
jgi:hypothetical protein